MPHRPEDDWTRPLPRTPRGSGASGRPEQGKQEHQDTGGEPGWGPVDPADDAWVPDSRRRAASGPEVHDAPRADPPQDPSPPDRGRRRPRYGPRRLVAILLVLVLAYVVAMGWAMSSIWRSIDKVAATPTSSSRPAAGSGTNFLLVGTDGRENLTREERNELVTGHSTEGDRADTMMLLHLPDSGDPTLVSIPRDSYVDIPGEGPNKINAAYAHGGPILLADTVEQNTGLRLDGYLEIGFGGFVNVVQTVGGVRMCLDEAVQDEKTRLDLDAGCQQLEGTEALKYVRMRYGDPRGDLGRVERQREFLSALVDRLATPSTVLLPWRLQNTGTAVGGALTIGEDTSMLETGRMALGMRSVAGGGGQSITVPISDTNYSTPAGSAVLWDQQEAPALFDALRTDEPTSIEP